MLDRRTALTATGLYSLAAITPPLPTAAASTRNGPARRAGPNDVARIQKMASLFSIADDQFGGGHTRRALAAYLGVEEPADSRYR